MIANLLLALPACSTAPGLRTIRAAPPLWARTRGVAYGGKPNRHFLRTQRVPPFGCREGRALAARALDDEEDYEDLTGGQDFAGDDVFVDEIKKCDTCEKLLSVALKTPASITVLPEYEEALRHRIFRIDPLLYPGLVESLINSDQTQKTINELAAIEQAIGDMDMEYAEKTQEEKFRPQRIILGAVADSMLENSGWDDFNPGDLGDIGWGFAVVGFQYPPLFKWIKEGIYRKPNWQYTPRAVSRLVYLWASCVKGDWTVMERLLTIGSAPNFMDNMSSNDVAIIYQGLQAVPIDASDAVPDEIVGVIGEYLALLKIRALALGNRAAAAAEE